MIQLNEISKNFGNNRAVDRVSLDIKKGEIFGLLGPNGAGKSTTIKILVTILKSDSGSAFINGYNVVKDQTRVRESVGIIFQDPSLDERLTAGENLYFHSRLYHVPSCEIKKRTDDALELVGLTGKRNDQVLTFSGGMKRRLEIARGIIHTPKVLFLDEPTIGLDPQTRKHIWKYLEDLKKREEITILLTTHYMEEAEICGRIAIIDHGRIIALDTPSNLKKSIKEDVITITTVNNEETSDIILEKLGLSSEIEGDALRITVPDGIRYLPMIFEAAGRRITGADIKKPTLEDVFINLTGRTIRDELSNSKDRLKSAVRRKNRK